MLSYDIDTIATDSNATSSNASDGGSYTYNYVVDLSEVIDKLDCLDSDLSDIKDYLSGISENVATMSEPVTDYVSTDHDTLPVTIGLCLLASLMLAFVFNIFKS